VRVVSPETDLLDRFEIVVDPTAEPVDFDEVLADFLLGLVERRRRGPNKPVLAPGEAKRRARQA